jgi:aryl-alcohol dehydrogenase-like predicted oxidoreductase
LHRKVKTNGVLKTAHQLGVTLIAFMPLRSGLLTGKLHADRDLAARLPRLRRTIDGLTNQTWTAPPR